MRVTHPGRSSWFDLKPTANAVVLQYIFLACSTHLFPVVDTLRVKGVWNSSSEIVVIAKFGFQQTDLNSKVDTHGYIFGNISFLDADGAGVSQKDSVKKAGALGHLFLTDGDYFKDIYSDRHLLHADLATGCARVLANISKIAFHPYCFKNGSQDLMRRIPCPVDQLCPDEDNPANVVRGHQFTFKIQDRVRARYWYLALVSCHLDSHCKWTGTAAATSVRLNYDVWLVNGAPDARYSNPFEHQFSMDQQDVFEIYASALILFTVLFGLQVSAVRTYKTEKASMLVVIIGFETGGLLLNSLHVIIFAYDGIGVVGLHIIGDGLLLIAGRLLILLFLLLAKGWNAGQRGVASAGGASVPFQTAPYQGLKRAGDPEISFTIALWFAYCLAFIGLFIWNGMEVDELEDIDIFSTWPGWGLLVLRVAVAVWFLLELRRTLFREYDEAKAKFLLYTGAGILVWFISLPVLGLIATTIEKIWRFKIVLGLNFFADFMACALLIHLFWPRGRGLRFSVGYNRGEVRLSEDLDEFERALIMEDISETTSIQVSSSRQPAHEVPPVEPIRSKSLSEMDNDVFVSSTRQFVNNDDGLNVKLFAT